MTSWTCQFILDHPYSAFFLAWPVAFVLIAASWFTAEVITRGMNTALQMVSLLVNGTIIALRGYAPQSAEAHPEDEDTP
jgi:hypothetical protein